MLNRVALALLAAVLPWGVVVPASAQTDEPLPIPPRHDLVGSLVGTRLDPALLSGPEEVSVIVELTGDAAPERAARTPWADDAAATREVLREQRGVDLALRLSGAVVTGRLTQTMNAVTARVRAADLPRLERTAGVKSVQVARRVGRANALANAATELLFVDLALSLVLVAAGLIRDARSRGVRYAPYLALALFFGSVGPLLYLVAREARRESLQIA